jgi:radical SAM protein with 4Fe4S-binding SPASM domain
MGTVMEAPRPETSGAAGGGRVAVAVMGRALVPGRVKTRLAAGVGAARALELYARLLAGTLDQVERLEGCDRVLALAGDGASRGPADDERDGRDASAALEHVFGALALLAERPAARAGWQLLPQRGATLGERLAAVVGDLFTEGAAGVVVVGSDSPPIPEEYLRSAVELAVPAAGGGRASTVGRLVLGPAADGGYYLIATDRASWEAHGAGIRTLLGESPMGTPGLLATTVRGAARLGLDVVQLPLWIDVDEVADLPAFERLTGAAPSRGEPLQRLREVYLHVTHRCRQACRHCYDRGRGAPGDELTTAEWRRVIDQCADLGATGFVFIGGDPLLRDDLEELVAHVTGVRGATARFFFNGLVGRARAETLADAGHGRLRPLVSIDGPREVNDTLRGEGNHAGVFASIRNLQAAGLDPVANTVLVRPVLPGLPQLARELRQAGVGRLHLILPHEHGGVPAEPGLVPGEDELLAAVDALMTVAREVGLVVDNLPSWRRRVARRNDLCAAGCRDLAIDPFGRVHACAITVGDPAFVAGDLRRERLGHVWRTSPALRLLRAASARDRDECAACPVVDACGGECWVQAHYAARAHDRSAGFRAPFPYCGLVRPMLERLGAGPAAGHGAHAAGHTAHGAGRDTPPEGAAAPPADDCVAAGACGGQAAAGEVSYDLFDCI